MPYMNVEVIEGVYAPTGSGTTTLHQLVPTAFEALGHVVRVIGFVCKVVTAGDGTGTVSFDLGGGVAQNLMSTANVGANATGVKDVATAATKGINGHQVSAAATATTLRATYTVGTNTVHPVIQYRLAYTMDTTWKSIVGLA